MDGSFGNNDQQPQPVHPEELTAAARLMWEHADDPGSHVCRICGVSRCRTWRDADAVVLRGLMQSSGVALSKIDQDQETGPTDDASDADDQ